MAQIDVTAAPAKKGKRLPATIRIDMTPMVDLGFLLITFFIFTTTMAEKRSTGLIMPTEGPACILGDKHALTVLLGKSNEVYAYEGGFEEAQASNRIIRTGYNTYDGIGKLIREKQKVLLETENIKGKENLMLLIKPTAVSSYKNLIDALDETTINNVKKYAIVDLTPEEKEFMKK